MSPKHATLELKIHGMDCSGCARHLESVVKRIVGVTKITTLLADRKAVMLYDPDKTTPAAICWSVATAGYTIITDGDEEAPEAASAILPPPPAAQMDRQDQLHNESPRRKRTGYLQL